MKSDLEIESREVWDVGRRTLTLPDLTDPQAVPYKPISIKDLSSLDIRPKEFILSPWLSVSSLNMVHAYRGVGKTFFCLEVAKAISLGTSSMNGWKAEKPRRVLYIDGEMAAIDLQERVNLLFNGQKFPDNEYFQLLNPFNQQKAMPDLSDQTSRDEITKLIRDLGSEFVIIDNLSCLIRGEHPENEAKWWEPVQPWALARRAEGVSVLFVHHSGKSGKQRGTSKTEDIMDTVIQLRRPTEAKAEDGAIFEVCFEKNRALRGKDVEAFEARLDFVAGKSMWTTKSHEAAIHHRISVLADEGMTQRDIANILGISPGTVSYHLKKLTQTIPDVKF